MLERLRCWAVALVICGCCLAPSLTHAQNSKIEADFKGAIGLGLVGAELGAVIPAIAGADATWTYLVFPAVGAAGGALAGYFALDRANHAELSVAALTAGMALVIPALIATLQLTSYDGGDTEPQPAPGTFVRARRGARRDADIAASTDTDAARRNERAETERRIRRRLAAGPGMFRVSEGQLALAAPGFALLPGTNGKTAVAGVSLALMSGQF